jgi:hypothetical protein
MSSSQKTGKPFLQLPSRAASNASNFKFSHDPPTPFSLILDAQADDLHDPYNPDIGTRLPNYAMLVVTECSIFDLLC